MQNTNTINGLFHIPDESSFIKKLILNYPSVKNPDIVLAFKALQELHPSLEMVQKEHYFSLLLPTQSPGLQLEAMLITSQDDERKLFSIYHRLHFDSQIYPQGPQLLEADMFLHLSSILVNVPLSKNIEALASVLNYQVQEALNIEITMLSLADSSVQIVEEDITPFIHNTIGRYMLAATLDNDQYIRPINPVDLSHLICGYCDLPLESVSKGIENQVNFKEEVLQAEYLFIPNFASSTLCLMLLLIEKKTSSAMLEEGSFKTIKDFLTDKRELYSLKELRGEGESLGDFQELT